MRCLKNKTGAVTVEAALVLPIFISVVITIAFLIKLVYVQEMMQHAISQTADEIASYSYLFEVSGFKETHDEVRDELNERSRLFKDHLSTITDSYEGLQHSYDSTKKNLGQAGEYVQEGDVNGAKNELEENKKLIEEAKDHFNSMVETAGEVRKDPKAEVKSIISMIASGAFENMKTELCIPLVTLYMGKHLADGGRSSDDRLKQFNVTGGFDGLDFSQSSFFENRSEDIDIVVRYKVDVPVPFNFLPEFDMVQRATVKAWLGGKYLPFPSQADKNTTRGIADEILEFTEDYWALEPMPRGRAIAQVMGNNLGRFCPVDILQGRELTSIKSHDLVKADNCQGDKLLEVLQKDIDELVAFKDYSRDDIAVYSGDYDIKQLKVAVPDCELSKEQAKSIEEARSYAKKKGIKFVLVVVGVKKENKDAGQRSQQ